MLKCLECRNYTKNGKIHKCRCYPEVTFFSADYPSEPLKESCGKFERFKHRTEVKRGKGKC